MNTLTASDIRHILENLDKIKVLTRLAKTDLNIPCELVWEAEDAATTIRDRLLGVALVDVQVEQVKLMEEV